MSKFDMIIGYTATKKELKQIADTLRNRDVYDKLGVSAPRGLLLHGQPGVGKSLMASAIIEASERPAFVCRKDKPNGDFVKEIKATFDKAMQKRSCCRHSTDWRKRRPETESRSAKPEREGSFRRARFWKKCCRKCER